MALGKRARILANAASANASTSGVNLAIKPASCFSGVMRVLTISELNRSGQREKHDELAGNLTPRRGERSAAGHRFAGHKRAPVTTFNPCRQ
jgi:hypothetical protein